MADINALRRCKMCGKMQPIKFHRTWLFFGKMYKGCKFCRMNMITTIRKENQKTDEDELI